jgi:hypothetical protein
LTVDDCKIHDIEHGVRSYGDGFTVTHCEFYRLGRTGVYASGPDAANGGSDQPLSMTLKNNWFRDFIPVWKENHAVHVKYRNRIGEISYNIKRCNHPFYGQKRLPLFTRNSKSQNLNPKQYQISKFQ